MVSMVRFELWLMGWGMKKQFSTLHYFKRGIDRLFTVVETLHSLSPALATASIESLNRVSRKYLSKVFEYVLPDNEKVTSSRRDQRSAPCAAPPRCNAPHRCRWLEPPKGDTPAKRG